ncbi:MAG: cysteine synthase A [Pseudoflavonifractor sp.]|nr:cysteine synthase A [Alloprevotella sp.]MCM1116171.1 cysteine synthase A [Pseudoflavonifractor sp.]
MKKIVKSMIELIGNTPLLEPLRYCRSTSATDATLLLKLEAFNPGGSVKDRVALSMIVRAEQEGILKPGATIIEPTSGNTGIGLAWICAIRGYKLILTMPDTMSVERRRLLLAYGASIDLTPGKQGMKGAIERAQKLRDEIPGSVILDQFANPANPSTHYAVTGHEIWRDTSGKVDVFVAGVGTGGTVSGIGRYLKEKKASVEVVAVEPADSPVLSGGKPGPHKLQGIGAGFIPSTYNGNVVDTITTVTTEQAVLAARALARTEGVLTGFSGGAALFAASQLALKPQYKGKTIVALIPDTGDRYLSTDLFPAE